MIVCDRRRMIFVHIPKCAGSTIVTQLQTLNDFARGLHATLAACELGPVSAYRLPLDLVRERFSDQFEKFHFYDEVMPWFASRELDLARPSCIIGVIPGDP